uniref:Uncharacterized protein n=1 Tax=Avena sativa TaxID=4498 RepID=A0ACD5UY99_AVESA
MLAMEKNGTMAIVASNTADEEAPVPIQAPVEASEVYSSDVCRDNESKNNKIRQVLGTLKSGYNRRWICKTRWLHQALIRSGRLVVGLGVQWTPVRGRGDGQWTPPPATLQLCVGHRCLVFHLAQVDPDAVPAALYRFLADPRVVFVGYGSSYDRRMLWEHYGLHVEYGHDLRALAGMGNASVELMAQRFLGYPGIGKPWNVAMSAWHAPRLSVEQVEYACVDAYLAFRLGLLLCPGALQPVQRAPVPPRAPPPAPRAPVIIHAPPRAPVLQRNRAPAPALVHPRAPPPAPRALVPPRARTPAPRTPVVVRAPPRAPVLELHRPPGPALVFPRAPTPAPRALVLPRVSPPSPRTPQAVAVDAAENSSKIAETRPGFTLVRSNYASPGFTGLDAETERGGLTLVRSNYSSDEDDDLSSDEFDLRERGAVTDDDDEEEDVYDYVDRTGLLSDGDYIVEPGDGCDDDEEDVYEEDYVVGTRSLNAEDVGEQGYAYKEYAGIGILTVEDHIEEGYKEYTGILTVNNEVVAYDKEAFVSNGPVTVAFEEEGGCLQLDGYHAPPEHLGSSPELEEERYGDSIDAFQGGEDGYGQDDGGDWYDQGDEDDGFRGSFWKAARIGERLSPWVAFGCFAIGISTIFF